MTVKFGILQLPCLTLNNKGDSMEKQAGKFYFVVRLGKGT